MIICGYQNPDDEVETEDEVTYRRAIDQGILSHISFIIIHYIYIHLHIEKVIYKESFERLRVLKPEIEHIRKVLFY